MATVWNLACIAFHLEALDVHGQASGLYRLPYILIQFPRKLFFFEFGNPVTVHKGAETIQGKKLFKGGNYMRKYGKQFSGNKYHWIRQIQKSCNGSADLKDYSIFRVVGSLIINLAKHYLKSVVFSFKVKTLKPRLPNSALTLTIRCNHHFC